MCLTAALCTGTSLESPLASHYKPYSLHHTPYTIHHTPYTIHHTPYTIHHTPYTSVRCMISCTRHCTLLLYTIQWCTFGSQYQGQRHGGDETHASPSRLMAVTSVGVFLRKKQPTSRLSVPEQFTQHCNALYNTVPYCAVHYIQCCILHGTVLHCPVMCYTALYCATAKATCYTAVQETVAQHMLIDHDRLC